MADIGDKVHNTSDKNDKQIGTNNPDRPGITATLSNPATI